MPEEIRTDKSKPEKKRSMAAYVLPAFLILLLAANILIRVATPRVNLYEEGKDAITSYGKAIYVLPEGSYEVLGSFADEAGSTSHIPMYTWERQYFSILVTDASGEKFVMAARVQGREMHALSTGRPVELKGMVSSLSDEKAAKLQESMPYAARTLVYCCLNDNGNKDF